MAGDEDLKSMLGEPHAAIRRMVMPFLISIIVVQINVFTDTFWVSGLGIGAVSGMTTAVPINGVFSNIAVGLSVGAVATMAYRLGAGDRDGASRLAGNAILTGVLLSILASLIIVLLLDPLVDFMGAGDVREEVFDYTLPMIMMSPFVVLNTVFGGLLRAEGNAKRSTAVQMSAAVFNMALDPLLIYGLGMGLMGAGLATALSSCFGLALAAHWYLRGRTAVPIRRGDLALGKDVGKELMTVAGPRTLEGLVMSVTVLFQRVFIIIASGTPGVSLFNVPFRYVNLSMCPSEATGMAMVPVAAAAYGQKDLAKMKSAMMYAFKLSLGFAAVLTVVLFALSGPLISLFMWDPSMDEWRDAFMWNMAMYSVILPFFSVQTMGSSFLQAMKRSKRPMEVTMIVGFVRLGLFWAASAYDYRAITYALIASYVISALLMIIMARHEFKVIEKKAAASGA
ncbi:MAG: MATE family efflux transporter [Candidatus Methanomethylophilaceae archaeon]|nr:MATE family efflux transporter [Candidatus Methanomethylophilaceae archaeon]